MFDLEKEVGGVYPEPTREEMKQHKQKRFNERQKSLMKTVGENLAAYSCVLIFVLLIGFIWTDIGININVQSVLTDALVTIVLFVLGEFCMAQVGRRGGKLDDEYRAVHEEYLKLRDRVRQAGITLMDAFCDWQIDVEYEFYIRKRCKELKIDYKAYVEEYSGKSLEELGKLLPLDVAAKVFALSQTKQIELSPDILMTDGKVRGERGGVGQSGEEYVEKHTTGWTHLLITAAFGIVAAVPAFTLTQDVSVGRVIYTIFKLAMLCYRMYLGYSRGAKGFNTIEPKHLQAKIKYLNLYLEFLDKKIYIALVGKYNIYTESEMNGEDRREGKTDEVRAGEVQGGFGNKEASIRDHTVEVLRS